MSQSLSDEIVELKIHFRVQGDGYRLQDKGYGTYFLTICWK